MHGDILQQCARARADELPGAWVGYPFGPDWEVFKVRDKVFMLLTDTTGESIITLKADPEDARALRESHSDIQAGYHMNKKHWITVKPGGDLQADHVEELVTESYRLVVKNLPRARRPIDPETFGRSEQE